MRRRFTTEDIEYIKLHYENERTDTIATYLNRNVSSIYKKSYDLGLKKSESFLNSIESGRLNGELAAAFNTRFKKGHVPANKGKQMSDELYAKCNKTMFKKGNRPHNWKPIGYERITVDGYIEVKVKEPRTFKLKQRIEWEKHNGQIAPGQNIIFKDGNKTNIDITNLQSVSNEELMAMNTIQRYPKELQSTILLHSKLKRTILKTTSNE